MSQNRTPKRRRGLPLLAALVLVAAVILSGFYRVGPGEEGVVLTLGSMSDLKGPGLYWHIPLFQHVETGSVSTIYTAEYGFRTSQIGTHGSAPEFVDVSDESVMLTGDDNLVSVEAVYQYQVRDLRDYLFEVEDPEGTMRLAFETVMRRNIQNRDLDDALLNKEALEQEVLPDFQEALDSYNIGVEVRMVRIQNIAVPSEVAAAYEDVNNAKNEKTARLDEAERYKNNVIPAARSAAYQLLQEAEAYKAETIAAAEADVAVFSALYEKYVLAPEVTRSRMVYEVLEKVLSGSAKLYIVDSDSGVTQLLNLGEETPASGAAAILGGE